MGEKISTADFNDCVRSNLSYVVNEFCSPLKVNDVYQILKSKRDADEKNR